MDYNHINEVQDMPQEKKNSLDYITDLKRIDLEIAKLNIDKEHKEANQQFWKKNERHWNRLFIIGIITVIVVNTDKVILLISSIASLF